MTTKVKVCLLGAFAAGKTSLVRRRVYDSFSSIYQTTIDANIETLELPERELKLVIWDIHGDDRFQTVRADYVRGAGGCIFVVDASRPETLDVAIEIEHRLEVSLSDTKRVWAVTKSDLVGRAEAAELEGSLRQRLGDEASVRWTSSKTGDGVNGAFSRLAELIQGGASHV